MMESRTFTPIILDGYPTLAPDGAPGGGRYIQLPDALR